MRRGEVLSKARNPYPTGTTPQPREGMQQVPQPLEKQHWPEQMTG